MQFEGLIHVHDSFFHPRVKRQSPVDMAKLLRFGYAGCDTLKSGFNERERQGEMNVALRRSSLTFTAGKTAGKQNQLRYDDHISAICDVRVCDLLCDARCLHFHQNSLGDQRRRREGRVSTRGCDSSRTQDVSTSSWRSNFWFSVFFPV